MSGEAKRLPPERLAFIRRTMVPSGTTADLVAHIDAVEAELRDAASAVTTYMSVAADHSDWIDKVEKERDELRAALAKITSGDEP